jgi:hypothetical protein
MRQVVLPLIALSIIGLSACGGETLPPKPPETAPSALPAAPPSAAPETSATPANPPADNAKPAEAAPEAAVVVAALKFVPGKGSKAKAMALKEDGSVMEGDKVVAKISSDTLQDAEGNTIATVSKDGVVTIPNAEKPLKFSDIGELESDAGMKISVADDGTPTKVEKAKAKPDSNLGKFEGFNPKVRRAAALMLALEDLKKEAAKAKKAAEKAAKAAAKPEKPAKPEKADKPAAKPEKADKPKADKAAAPPAKK